MLNNLKCGIDNVQSGLECIDFKELGAKCRDILKKYHENYDLMMLKLAELVADDLIDHYSPKTLNVEKPELLRVYESLSEVERIQFEKKYPQWHKRESVSKYMRLKDSIESENASNVYWLKVWRDRLAGDQDRQVKLTDKIREFNGLIKAPAEIKEKVDDTLQEFGGKVVTQNLIWGEEEEL